MDFCKYHPITPATYHCNFCQAFHCDCCTDEGDSGHDDKCFTCNRTTEALGATNIVTPYWRRLQESFRYPLDKNCITLIIGSALLTAFAEVLPLLFMVLLVVAITGAFLKYCFACLESTAGGNLKPPDITEAYSGGIAIIGGLLAIIVVMSGVVFFAFRFLGPQMAGLVGFLILLCLPAIIIIYGMSDSLLEAMNPVNVIKLVTSIGLPYGLILAFIMIMSASVGVIIQLIGTNFSFLSSILQSIVTDYYMIVTFHIMGYMIFQYQGKLGFTAREDFGEEIIPRPPRDKLAVRIDIALKEGDYNQVITLFDEALKTFPSDKEFQKQYFEFLFATRRVKAIDKAASRYLKFLIRSRQEHQLRIIYKRVLQLNPKYLPDTAELRHRLAQACHESGDPTSAVKLINGLHKAFPKYPNLADAFELMADALEDLPNQKEQADKCRELAKRLAALKPAPAPKAISAKPEFKPQPNQTTSSISSSASTLALEPIEEEKQDAQKQSGDLPPIEFK